MEWIISINRCIVQSRIIDIQIIDIQIIQTLCSLSSDLVVLRNIEEVGACDRVAGLYNETDRLVRGMLLDQRFVELVTSEVRQRSQIESDALKVKAEVRSQLLGQFKKSF